MLQTQGLRPLDPYRALQLHPLARCELIEDVYRALVEREKAAAASAPESARIAGLHEAYALLVDDARRAAYDEANGFAGASVMPRLAEQRAGQGSDGGDYYETLRVDREAGALVVGIAYRAMVMRAGVGPGPEAARRRGLLDEAYRTLSNRELRAQYDLALARQPAARAAEGSVTSPVAAVAFPDRPSGEEGAAPAPPAPPLRRGFVRRLLSRDGRDPGGQVLTAEERRLLALCGGAAQPPLPRDGSARTTDGRRPLPGPRAHHR
ncbi:MAG: J domain-containing protein [Dehalococcoidia bacterium]